MGNCVILFLPIQKRPLHFPAEPYPPLEGRPQLISTILISTGGIKQNQPPPQISSALILLGPSSPSSSSNSSPIPNHSIYTFTHTWDYHDNNSETSINERIKYHQLDSFSRQTKDDNNTPLQIKDRIKSKRTYTQRNRMTERPIAHEIITTSFDVRPGSAAIFHSMASLIQPIFQKTER